jgi:hypothetical protein
MSVNSLAGRVGGLTRSAMYDGREMTAAARQRYRQSFAFGHECQLCPKVQIAAQLPLSERQRRAEALRRAHFSRLALASARARARRPGPAR